MLGETRKLAAIWPEVLTVLALLFFFALSPVLDSAIGSLGIIVLLLAMIFGWKGLSAITVEQKALLIGFCAYVVLALVSMVNNDHLSVAGWRFERYYPFLFTPLLLGLFLRITKLSEVTVLMMVLSALALGAMSAYQQGVLGMARVGVGTGFNPNIFGHLASLPAVVLFAAVLCFKASVWQRVGLLICAAVAAYAVLASGSRGVFISMLAAMALMAFIYIRRLQDPVHRRWATWGIVGLAAMLMTVMLMSSFWGAHWVRLIEEPQRFFAGDHSYTSFAHRAVMLMGAWEIWWQNPILGTGLGDFVNDYAELVRSGVIPSLGGEGMHVFHNVFADALATTGIVGTLGMVLAIFLLPARFFKRVLASSTGAGQGAFIGLAGVAVLMVNLMFGLTNSWLYLRGLPFVLILMMVLIAAAPRQQEQ